MPRYYFHVHDDRSEIDTAGIELHDHEAAQLMAIQSVGDILKSEAHRIALGTAWRMEVTDDRSTVLYQIEVRLSDPRTIA